MVENRRADYFQYKYLRIWENLPVFSKSILFCYPLSPRLDEKSVLVLCALRSVARSTHLDLDFGLGLGLGIPMQAATRRGNASEQELWS